MVLCPHACTNAYIKTRVPPKITILSHQVLKFMLGVCWPVFKYNVSEWWLSSSTITKKHYKGGLYALYFRLSQVITIALHEEQTEITNKMSFSVFMRSDVLMNQSFKSALSKSWIDLFTNRTDQFLKFTP